MQKKKKKKPRRHSNINYRLSIIMKKKGLNEKLEVRKISKNIEKREF